MSALQVGVARGVITPPIGTPLAGYMPTRPAKEIHDDLHATAFAFSDGKQQAMLVAFDLCTLRTNLHEMLRAEIAKETGLSAEQLILCCTHTHSGPIVLLEEKAGETYVKTILTPILLDVIKDALANLQPAEMGIGTTESKVGINRRVINPDGSMKHGQCPYGTFDPLMTVVSFRAIDGTPIGNLIHYNCHNTASGKNDEVTRDWCGVAIDRLEKLSGGITAYINGCAGDAGPRLSNGKTTADLQSAMELGGIAASDAVAAWRNIKSYASYPLTVSCEGIRMPIEPIGTEEEILQKIAAVGDPTTFTPGGLREKRCQNLMRRIHWLREGNTAPDAIDMPITNICVGPLAFHPLPFEPFSMVGLRIKEHSPFAHTLCVGYANAHYFYFPSVDQLARGGYEIEVSRSANLLPFATDAENHLVKGSIELLQKIYDKAAL